ncbi:ABC transporter permease [Sphingobium phenoxybenzoativorans]|uniref:ABC transporter permease n=1 Tax=Sphingobium phenoxybenzoativorans TaxID=1592790 RepID=A0A975Q1U7_9SPHN|nr:ABC transporter permease [Sphingobium phenoxybenzoativorans]QUT06174.1 ABC transporter permease [Sphingobium phenoxybenzoativorans]
MNETLRAAFVIAQRDFTAVILSKTFILFLLGPLFPLIIFVFAQSFGDKIDKDVSRPAVGVAMSALDTQRLTDARDRITQKIGDQAMPVLRPYPAGTDPKAMLAGKDAKAVAMLSGTLSMPRLTGKEADIRQFEGDLGLLIGVARAGSAMPDTPIAKDIVSTSSGSEQQSRLVTGRTAQVLLFLLTMLLAGMVLSNMVEEKTNKIIEILAAAVPVDAIFLGKLIAMLGMSFVGIAVWGLTALTGYAFFMGTSFPMPTPAIGWPMFVLLFFLYFATAYTLLGSLFIGVGAQASTVREVQTLSMPITMCQVVIFFFASYAVNRMGEAPEVAAAIFPFSSPFAMIARAAQSDAIWPHLLAIVWQLLWVALIIRIGVRLFRRNVLKSGGGGRKRLFGRKAGPAA